MVIDKPSHSLAGNLFYLSTFTMLFCHQWQWSLFWLHWDAALLVSDFVGWHF